MQINRRSAIVAALASLAGMAQRAWGQTSALAYVNQSRKLTMNFVPVEWDIPTGMVSDYSRPKSRPAQKPEDKFDFIYLQEYEQVPVTDVLIVRFDGREARLTGKDIMDALEGKA